MLTLVHDSAEPRPAKSPSRNFTAKFLGRNVTEDQRHRARVAIRRYKLLAELESRGPFEFYEAAESEQKEIGRSIDEYDQLRRLYLRAKFVALHRAAHCGWLDHMTVTCRDSGAVRGVVLGAQELTYQRMIVLHYEDGTGEDLIQLVEVNILDINPEYGEAGDDGMIEHMERMAGEGCSR